jgi:hypothetical protein
MIDEKKEEKESRFVKYMRGGDELKTRRTFRTM